jgi:hypothetical protein
MTAITARLKLLLSALLFPVLLPVHLGMPYLHVRLGRLRAARASGDRGAISIELALAIIVMVTIAGAVLAAVKILANKTEAKIPTDVPDSVK